MTMAPPHGRLVIISGPSGAGKSTIVRRLLRECHMPLRLSVSATTRAPRPGEADGIDYHFLSREEFAHRRAAGEFLECKEVFGRGDWYGTLESEIQSGFRDGSWVILEIDVEGAMCVLERYSSAITIFLHSGTLEELERRLRERGTEGEAAIQRRLEVARHELEYRNRYRHEVVNRTPDQAVRDICQILVQSAK
jgi:guanylate kinase